MNRHSCSNLILLITVTSVLLFYVEVKCEIHRARSVQTYKPRFRSVDKLEPVVTEEIASKFDEISIEKDWACWLDDVVFGHSRRIWLYSFIASALVGLTGLFPLLVIPINCGGILKSKATTGRLNLLLSFAVGGLLGDVFLHLLPEAWAHAENYGSKLTGYRNIGLWFLVGLLSFFFIEKMAGESDDDEDEEEDEEEEEDENVKGIDDEDEDEIIIKNSKKNYNHQNNYGNGHVMASDGHVMASDESSEGESGPRFEKLIRNERSGTSNRFRKQINNKSSDSCQKEAEKCLMPNKISSSSSPSSSLSTLSSLPPPSSSSPSSSSPSSSSSPKKEGHIKVSGWLNLLANVVDNFTHGLAVAGSFCISPKMGVLTTLAILLHEIPHEIGDFAILLQAGFDRWRAAKAQVMTATGGIIGAMIALSAESVKRAGDSTAWILPFTAGGFINIALVAIVPDLMKEKCARNAVFQVVLVCTGIFVMGLVTALVE